MLKTLDKQKIILYNKSVESIKGRQKQKKEREKMYYLDRYFNGKYVGTEIFNSESIAKGFANKRRAEGYTVELKTF